jgi:hypothetical protein
MTEFALVGAALKNGTTSAAPRTSRHEIRSLMEVDVIMINSSVLWEADHLPRADDPTTRPDD